MLQVLEGYPLKALGFHSSDSVHLMTEAMRHAYRDRNTYLGDPAFVDNPTSASVVGAPYAERSGRAFSRIARRPPPPSARRRPR